MNIIKKRINFWILTFISLTCIVCNNNRYNYLLEYAPNETMKNLVYVKVTTESNLDDTLDIIVYPPSLYLDHIKCHPEYDSLILKAANSHKYYIDTKFEEAFRIAVDSDSPYMADSLLYRTLESQRFFKDKEICRLYLENGAEYIYNTFVDNDMWIYKMAPYECQDSLKLTKAYTIMALLQKHGYSFYDIYDGFDQVHGYKILKRKY